MVARAVRSESGVRSGNSLVFRWEAIMVARRVQDGSGLVLDTTVLVEYLRLSNLCVKLFDTIWNFYILPKIFIFLAKKIKKLLY